MSTYKNIIFDVGSVLVNWMRKNLYTTLFHGDKEKAQWMIDHIVTNSWNDQTDLPNVSSLMIGKPMWMVLRKWVSRESCFKALIP